MCSTSFGKGTRLHPSYSRAARPVEQCEIGFVLRQWGQEIVERREDPEAHALAVAVMGPEQRRLPDDVGFRNSGRELAMHRLGDDEADVVREYVIKPAAAVRGGVGVTEGGLYPNLAIAHLDREGRRVARPQIEGAAALEVEAGVVKMAGEDAVLEAAPVEREAHARAPIVEREDPPAVMDDEDREMGAMHDEPALGADGSLSPQRGPRRRRDKQTRPASVAQKETPRSSPRQEILAGTPPACARDPPLRALKRRSFKRAQPQALHLAETEFNGTSLLRW